jgi:hypothetical protein
LNLLSLSTSFLKRKMRSSISYTRRNKIYSFYMLIFTFVIAQAVSRWLPTVAARVRVRAACGVCGGQSGIGAGFLRVLRFPLPIIPPISPSS